MAAKTHYYNGAPHTVSELAALSGLPQRVIYQRLREGWSIEKIVETPYGESDDKEWERWRNKTLNICFVEPVPVVRPDMQPTLGKVYVASPGVGNRKIKCSKDFFIIALENGKPLVVYPNEFEILGEAEPV